MPRYNKLVRNKIHEIIAAEGKEPITRIINGDEYFLQLQKKLQEEVDEYFESGEIEELADILEVVHALVKTKGISIQELEEIRIQKAEKRGGFSKRIFLEEVKDSS